MTRQRLEQISLRFVLVLRKFVSLPILSAVDISNGRSLLNLIIREQW